MIARDLKLYPVIRNGVKAVYLKLCFFGSERHVKYSNCLKRLFSLLIRSGGTE
jgi:hypothetical protein